MTEKEIWSIAAALEHRSQHPLAAAIVQEAEDQGADYRSADVNDFTSITGKGIKGIVENSMYFIGNPQLFTEYDVAIDH